MPSKPPALVFEINSSPIYPILCRLLPRLPELKGLGFFFYRLPDRKAVSLWKQHPEPELSDELKETGVEALRLLGCAGYSWHISSFLTRLFFVDDGSVQLETGFHAALSAAAVRRCFRDDGFKVSSTSTAFKNGIPQMQNLLLADALHKDKALRERGWELLLLWLRLPSRPMSSKLLQTAANLPIPEPDILQQLIPLTTNDEKEAEALDALLEHYGYAREGDTLRTAESVLKLSDPSLTARQLRQLWRQEKTPAQKLALLKHPNLPLPELMDGADWHPDAIYANPRFEQIRTGTLGKERTLRKRLASSSRLAPRHMAILVEDTDEGVRAALARNPLTSPEILTTLAADPSQKVRSSVARNNITPRETLVKLQSDPDERVSAHARRNKSAE